MREGLTLILGNSWEASETPKLHDDVMGGLLNVTRWAKRVWERLDGSGSECAGSLLLVECTGSRGAEAPSATDPSTMCE